MSNSSSTNPAYVHNVMTDFTTLTHPAILPRSLVVTSALQCLLVQPTAPEQTYGVFKVVAEYIRRTAVERQFRQGLTIAPTPTEYAEYMALQHSVPAGEFAAVAGIPEWCHYELVRYLIAAGINVVIPYPTGTHGMSRLHHIQ